MTKMYTIYRAFHKETGKSYIGFDSSWPKRKYKHEFHSKKEPLQYFHNALRKHGIDDFEWEVLYNSKDKDHCLDMEKVFIRQFDSIKEGYNLTEGGEGTVGVLHTEETKKLISNKHKGKVLSQEHRDKLSKAKLGKTSPNKGKKFTDEHRRKLSLAKLGIKRSDEVKSQISNKLKGRPSPNKGNKKNETRHSISD